MIVEATLRKVIMILILGILFSLRICFDFKNKKRNPKYNLQQTFSIMFTNWKRENTQSRTRVSRLALFHSLGVKEGQAYHKLLRVKSVTDI